MEKIIVTRGFSVDTALLSEEEIRSQAESEAAKWGGTLYRISDDHSQWLFPVRHEGASENSPISNYFIWKVVSREELQQLIDSGEITHNHEHYKRLLDGKTRRVTVLVK